MLMREISSRKSNELNRKKTEFWRRCRECDRNIMTSSKYNNLNVSNAVRMLDLARRIVGLYLIEVMTNE